MSNKQQTQAKAAKAPTPSFTPAQPGFVQGHHGPDCTPGSESRFAEFSCKPSTPQAPLIQAKLAVNQPDDRCEQEAHQTADRVMRTSEPGSGRLTQAPLIPDQAPEVTPQQEAAIQGTHGSGEPLDPATRAFFEPRFGHDFGRVRVHADDRAAQSAEAINARAYTAGQRIVFGPGQYAPQTMPGQELLAHELTHVVQQSQAAQPISIQRSEKTTTDPWVEKMLPLRNAAILGEMDADQQNKFVEGLNEAFSGRTSGGEIVLPVEKYPGDQGVKDGHVYFDKKNTYTSAREPAVTKPYCKVKGTVQMKGCGDYTGEEGAFIILGPNVVRDTKANTQALLDHEHFHLRTSKSGTRMAEADEEFIAYSHEFAQIYRMSAREMTTLMKYWLEYYANAGQSSRDEGMKKAVSGLHKGFDPMMLAVSPLEGIIESLPSWIQSDLKKDARSDAQTALEAIILTLDHLKASR